MKSWPFTINIWTRFTVRTRSKYSAFSSLHIIYFTLYVWLSRLIMLELVECHSMSKLNNLTILYMFQQQWNTHVCEFISGTFQLQTQPALYNSCDIKWRQVIWRYIILDRVSWSKASMFTFLPPILTFNINNYTLLFQHKDAIKNIRIVIVLWKTYLTFFFISHSTT